LILGTTVKFFWILLLIFKTISYLTFVELKDTKIRVCVCVCNFESLHKQILV